MGISTIDAGMLKNAFLAGAKGLEAKKDWINELNVFPVPGLPSILMFILLSIYCCK